MKQLMRKNWTVPYPRRSRASGTGSVWSNQESSFGAAKLKSFIKNMTEFRDNGTLSKEQFDQFVALACSAYVGQEVEKRVGNVLEEMLSPERLARYLSPSH